MESPAISNKKVIHPFVVTILLSLLLSSCYSVRLMNKNGIPEPDPLNTSEDFYRGKRVHVLDTVITLKPVEGEFYLIERCASGGFYSFEYKVTFGGVLLNVITFGKKRQVKIKYVCLKQSD
ncbi:hypothetical protein [Ilyomonas limi]|uniref:hypothetical protein n=1 Tax=Ilyomonas limi TaxID=2575867 RepID=UPI001485044C|nr:hypothetical protein [Ilyomonas limi]